ncbi:MAG TPA: DUF3999 domain-containing protein [Candidatus Binatia bacterium]
MIGLVFLLFFIPVLSSGAERPLDFAYGMTIEADAAYGLHEIELPAAVYRAVTRADLGDLRVFNGQGEVVPHALRPRVTVKEQAGDTVTLPAFPLWGEEANALDDLNLRVDKRSDGVIVDVRSRGNIGPEKKLRGYLLDASALPRSLTSLEFDWQSAAANFIGTVRIEGSDDLAHWKILADNAALARLNFGGHQVTRNRVELPGAKAKYMRVSWPASQPPLGGLTVRAAPSPIVVAAPRLWQRFAAPPSPGSDGAYSYDLGGAFMFDRLRVQLPQPNTLVQLQILSRAKSSDPWRPATSALAYRLREGDLEVASPEIIVSSRGERFWLLRVDQKGGGVGGGVLVIEIGWVPHTVVFAARGAGPFQLAYGSSRVKPAALAIESLIPGYKTQGEFKVVPAKLAGQVTLGGVSRLGVARDYKTMALWGSLILGVIILGWMAWRLSRQVSNPPAESPSAKNSH